MKTISAICLSVLSAMAQPWSGIIDSSRAVDWSGAGVVGGIPSATWTQCGSTVAAGASNTTIQNAINACSGNKYVLLGAGNFTGLTGLTLKTGVVLRGSGADQTFLSFTANISCGGAFAVICFNNGSDNYFGSAEMQPGQSHAANWASGYAKGTTQIVLNSIGSNGLSVGKWIVLDQDSDTATNSGYFVCQNISGASGPCSSESGADNYSRMIAGNARWPAQIVQITACSPCTNGSTFTISPGVYAANISSGRTPSVWWPDPFLTNSGLENMSIDSTNSNDLNSITMFNAANVWIKGIRLIRSSDTSRSMIHMVETAHATVQDSYLYEGPAAHSQNYGIEQLMTSDVLIQNNIFQQIVVPNLLHTAIGGVWAFNFAIDNRFDTAMSPLAGGHSGGVLYDLFEGNVGQKVGADNTHGNAVMGTVFRNYFKGLDTGQTVATNALYSSSWARYWNYLGNVLGTSGYHTTYQTAAAKSIYYLGQTETGTDTTTPTDPVTYTTAFRFGNYDTVTAAVRWCGNSGNTGWSTTCSSASEVPTAAPTYPNAVPASETFPSSFFLAAKPSWWPSAKAWPPIGPDVSGGNIANLAGHANTIPAQDCYLSTMGGAADGSGSQLTFNANTCYQQSSSGNGSAAGGNLSLGGKGSVK